MTDEDVRVAPQPEQQAPTSGIPSTTSGDGSTATTTQLKAPAASFGSIGSTLTRLFQGSGLRRPSKIPRLHKQQSSVSVASTTAADPVPAESSATSKRSASSTTSIASSSRETTPFSSPRKAPGKRLREPTKIVGRKRTRDEMLQAVADRLGFVRSQDTRRGQQPHSEELSSQTTLDDAVSLASYRADDEEDASISGSQTQVAEEDEDQKREQELLVARALQQDLLRDRARLRLKISSLKDDVEVYYELLVRMEQVAMAAKSRSVGREDHAEREGIVQLADRIEAIISAQATKTVAEEEENEDMATLAETTREVDDKVEEH